MVKLTPPASFPASQIQDHPIVHTTPHFAVQTCQCRSSASDSNSSKRSPWVCKRDQQAALLRLIEARCQACHLVAQALCIRQALQQRMQGAAAARHRIVDHSLSLVPPRAKAAMLARQAGSACLLASWAACSCPLASPCPEGAPSGPGQPRAAPARRQPSCAALLQWTPVSQRACPRAAK